MGQRGPIPMPSRLQELMGNPGKRSPNRNEPKPREAAPHCPEFVKADPVALREWRRYSKILRNMRMLTEADGTVLADLCSTQSHLVLLLQKLNEFNKASKTGVAGMVVASKNGFLSVNPIFVQIRACHEHILKLCRELGLTPSSRSRMQVSAAPEKPQNAFSKFREPA